MHASPLAALLLVSSAFAPAPPRVPATVAETDSELTLDIAGLRGSFHARGVEFARGDAPTESVVMQLLALGRPGCMQPVAPAELVRLAGRVELRRGTLSEWYQEHRLGIEQGFTIVEPPAPRRGAALRLALSLAGELEVEVLPGGRDAFFVTAGGRRLMSYGGLLAFDADGRDLPVRLLARAGRLVIEVEDAAARYPLTIDPLIQAQVARLHAGTPLLDARFGTAVGISGDLAVVGAPHDLSAGMIDGGAAYVFERVGTSWIQRAKLRAGLPAAGDRFGESVAIDGRRVVVGAPGRDGPGGADIGAAYVFQRCGAIWSERAVLEASLAGVPEGRPGDRFGAAVDLDGELLVVAAPRHDLSLAGDEGTIYAFLHDDGGTPADECDDSWLADSRLTGSDGGFPQAGERFGTSLSLSGEFLLAGSPYFDWGYNDDGKAYRFRRPCCSTWQIQGQYISAHAQQYGHFGLAVALDGDHVLIGGPDETLAIAFGGLVQTYEGNTYLGTLHQGGAGQLGDRFGASLATFADLTLVGIPGDRIHGSASGSALVYEYSNGAWQESVQLLASDGAPDDAFAGRVALDAGFALTGAAGADHDTSDQGAAYVHALTRLNDPDVQVFGAGDGSGAACPCSNESHPGAQQGCSNSTGYGAVLGALGGNSVAQDDLELSAWNLIPAAPALLYAADGQIPAGLAFGDGLRLGSGQIVRLVIATPSTQGFASWGPGLNPAGFGHWSAGDRRFFQAWYRDPTAGPCGSGFNTSNGISVLFRP